MFEKDVEKLKVALEKLNRDLPTTTLQRRFVEQRSVPQVKALYSYNKHGIDVVKGELMFLVAKVKRLVILILSEDLNFLGRAM
jgi:hypothetical protein